MSEAASSRTFESRFTARSYELDSFGHVNHGVFFNWFEQARFEAFEASGLTGRRRWARGARWWWSMRRQTSAGRS